MMTATEGQHLRDFLEAQLSLVVPETNHARLGEFVTNRLQETGCEFRAYLDLLVQNKAEMDLVIDASTIGETYFFRDESHFALLRDEILPIAALYTSHYGSTTCLADKIWASDINCLSLGALERGRYRNRSLRDDGGKFHPLLEPWIVRDEQGFQVDARVHKQVQVRKINLMTDTLDSIPCAVDILFLKNMMIYFPLERRRIIYQKVAAKLSPHGFLILGKSEVPFFESTELTLLERQGVFFFVTKSSAYHRGGKT